MRSKDLKGFWKPQKGDVTERRTELSYVKKKLKARRKSKGTNLPAKRPSEDGFYKSLEWRSLRYLVLKNCGGRCMCCGNRPSGGIVLHVDHIKPRKTHPHLALALDNLQVLCSDCNIGKGGWDSTDWRHFESI